LFGLKPEQIDVIVHPQSIIHSIVQFIDGSMKAQMGLPDMKLPIQYALSYPVRIPSSFKRFNFMDFPSFTFEKPDLETFKNLSLAYQALEKGGNAPCVLNAANEVAVEAFLQDKIKFLDIASVNELCLEKMKFIKNPTIDDYIETNTNTRSFAQSILKNFN
jgi:1-deoxy-D-xylulose-5-phosphate reductoisomerase